MAQGHLKRVVVLASHKLVRLAYPKLKKYSIYANRCPGLEQHVPNLEHSESMLDVAVYHGQDDPYETLLTAESEGWAGHQGDLSPLAGSEDCDYLWDLFKLLQVPSPLRLFVARAGAEKIPLLEQRVAALTASYAGLGSVRPGDHLFCTVFPTRARDVPNIRCVGWSVGKNGGVHGLPAAVWPVSA